MWRAGVISGVVLTEDREPAAGVNLIALRRGVVGGLPVFQRAGSDVSDDRGQYRLTGLAPGTYVVGAQTTNNRSEPTIFAPGSTDLATAMAIDLLSATERAGIDITIPRMRGVSVSGQIVGLEERTAADRVMLWPDGAPSVAGDLLATAATIEGDGRFRFDNVPSGRFVCSFVRFPRLDSPGAMQYGTSLRVVSPGQPLPAMSEEPALWAEATVSVDTTPVSDVLLAIRHGSRVTGQVVFEGPQAPTVATLRSSIVMLLRSDRPNGGGMQAARIEADRRFRTASVPPGKYTLVPFSLPGFNVKSIVAAGEDYAGRSLEVRSTDVTGVVITMTDRVATLHGRVTDARGGAVDGAIVYVFPADRRLWVDYAVSERFAAVTTEAGLYSTEHLMAGEYFVVASVQPFAVDWQLPELLAILAQRAIRVSVTSGQVEVRDLRIAS
jgi:protocatechuate 3,4-dioxygenase beta subunit